MCDVYLEAFGDAALDAAVDLKRCSKYCWLFVLCFIISCAVAAERLLLMHARALQGQDRRSRPVCFACSSGGCCWRHAEAFLRTASGGAGPEVTARRGSACNHALHNNQTVFYFSLRFADPRCRLVHACCRYLDRVQALVGLTNAVLWSAKRCGMR